MISAQETKTFQELSTDGFWWFKTHFVDPRDKGDELPKFFATSSCDLEQNYDVEDDYFRAMAVTYVKTFQAINASKRKDLFLESFHEALAQSILALLAAAYPRRRDHLSDDIELKRLVLGLCAEWTTGIRPHIPDDHWILKSEKKDEKVQRTSSLFSTTKLSNPLMIQQQPKEKKPDREPFIRASYTLHHSPFFRYYLASRGIEIKASSKVKLGVTLNASRVPHFLANHVPEDDKIVFRRKLKRSLRAAPKPLPVHYVLSNSGVARRTAMDDFLKHKSESRRATKSFLKDRRNTAATIDAEQKHVLESDTLREFASTLAKHRSSYHLSGDSVPPPQSPTAAALLSPPKQSSPSPGEKYPLASPTSSPEDFLTSTST